jgi:DNA repair protein RecN (Recombination protein N)
MLTKLHIRNYAIIDDLELTLRSGLNIITGETGAGKSILLNALNLILGERADPSALTDETRKCIVEGYFQLPSTDLLRNLFLNHELDLEEETIIRREISSNGKSRAFVNDTPVNLSVLKSIGSLLIDLHQQYDTQDLQSSGFQLEILDALANNKDLLDEYKKEYVQYKWNHEQWEGFKKKQTEAEKEHDYLTFQFDELSACEWKTNELESLESELKLLQHSEQIKTQLSNVYMALGSTENPIVQQLKVLLNKLRSQEALHHALPALSERMNGSLVELKDISDELEQIESSIVYDGQRIAVIEERLSKGYALLKKHGLKTTEDILKLQEDIEKKLAEFKGLDHSIAEFEIKMNLHFANANRLAKELSSRRKAVIPFLIQEVQILLTLMEMPNARIKVEMIDVALNAEGGDKTDFLFDANLSDKFEPIGKVASGGERSRLMLSIQSLVAKKLHLPTLIFDEIDTGISGEAARQVGLIMKSMSSDHQLIVITHQPQIAAKADQHYFVHKQKKGDRIFAAVKILQSEERVDAIAQMISGAKPSEASLKSASEMISQSHKN